MGLALTTIPAAAFIAGAVWDEPRASHIAALTFGEKVIVGNLTTSQIESMWDALRASHVAANTMGEDIQQDFDLAIGAPVAGSAKDQEKSLKDLVYISGGASA